MPQLGKTMKDDSNQINQAALRTLVRSIQLFQGEFSLLLARCNYVQLQEQIVQQLHQQSPLTIDELALEPSARTLYHTIANHLAQKPQPHALMVSGLESVVALDRLLNATNQVREEFRNFNFPLILWVTDEVLQKLIRLIPDFHSWSTKIKFVSSTEALINLITHTTDAAFAKIIDIGVGAFSNSQVLNLERGSSHRTQLESALGDLRERQVQLPLELEASLEFVLGQDTSRSLIERWQHYQRSLELWQKTICCHTGASLPFPTSPSQQWVERIGCVWYYKGLWWRSYGVENPNEYKLACDRSLTYFQELMVFFRHYQRRDLEAKFINALGEVLQRLERWQDLAIVAHHSLTLHQSLYGYPLEKQGFLHLGDGLRLAHDYVLLADVALAQEKWQEAKKNALLAIQIQEYAQQLSPSEQAIDWRNQYHRQFYFLALARALSGLNQKQEAINTLEKIRIEGNPQFDPRLYLRVLGELRQLYHQQGNYLQAWQLKLEQNSLQQEYCLCAFVGATYLKAPKFVRIPALPNNQSHHNQVNFTGGRYQDIQNLQEKLGRNDCQLTVVYGHSKVGKSSLMHGYLLPKLQTCTLDNREVLPIYVRDYSNWSAKLSHALTTALQEAAQSRFQEISSLLTNDLNSESSILEQLNHNGRHDFLSVLIFDQVEELCFSNFPSSQLKAFFDFVHNCLTIPYVKVILSVQQEYLQELCAQSQYQNSQQDCLQNLSIKQLDNPNQNIFYCLENFSTDQAKAAIQELITKAKLGLESKLIDRLGEDLTNQSEQVQPLQLQLIGFQLQTEGITTLAQYQHRGGKVGLLNRYLEAAIAQCGQENEATAHLLLNSLTAKNSSPLQKTKTELVQELGTTAANLDLIIEIFIGSGLVLKLPALPEEKYQLSVPEGC